MNTYNNVMVHRTNEASKVSVSRSNKFSGKVCSRQATAMGGLKNLAAKYDLQIGSNFVSRRKKKNSKSTSIPIETVSSGNLTSWPDNLALKNIKMTKKYWTAEGNTWIKNSIIPEHDSINLIIRKQQNVQGLFFIYESRWYGSHGETLTVCQIDVLIIIRKFQPPEGFLSPRDNTQFWTWR